MRGGVFVEGALEDRLFAEDVGQFAPAVDVLVELQVHHAGGGGLVFFVGLDAAVVNGQLLEVGQNAQRQLGAPGVAAELEGGRDVVADVDRGFFGFDEKLPQTADAEAGSPGRGSIPRRGWRLRG